MAHIFLPSRRSDASSDDPARRHLLRPTLHYVAALLLIACAAITSHIMLGSALSGMDADAPIINSSGRQRMLSEKTLRLSGELMVTQEPAEVARVKGELRAAFRQMRSTHERLVSMVEASSDHEGAFKDLRAAYLDGTPSLDHRLGAYFESLERLLAAGPADLSPRNPDYLALQAAHRVGLLSDLDRVVRIYERIARDKVEDFESLEMWLMVITLALLLVEALFIFRPLIQRLVAANGKLAAQNRLMAELAVSDTLTRLPNRTGFGERLNHLIDAQSGADQCAAVMMLDLDRFKNVNDKYGHPAGDRVLIEVGGRIAAQLRDVDTVARLGGDEFAIILRKLASPSDAASIAERIIEAICQPIALREGEVSVGTSVGITIFPETEGTSDQLMKFADLALGQAKRSGKGCYRFYDHSMQEEVSRKSTVADGLKDAFKQGHLKMFLQPIISLKNGQVEFAESLVRWDDGRQAPIAAGEFIEIIDEFQMAPRLEAVLFDQVFSQLARWREDGIDFPAVTLNLSGVNLRQTDLCERLTNAIIKHRLTANMVAIEILETALIDRGSETVVKNILKLHELGFRLMLDDFGMGFTSLSHLTRFPVHCIKIDKSFIQGVEESGAEQQIVDALLAMAKGLGISVVGEGIETEFQLRYLQEKGCDLGQGYLFHRPIPIEDFDRLLRGGAFGMNKADGTAASGKLGLIRSL